MPRGRHRSSRPAASTRSASTSAHTTAGGTSNGTSVSAAAAEASFNTSTSVTGKGRSSLKNQIYSHALPVHVPLEHGRNASASASADAGAEWSTGGEAHSAESWWHHVTSFFGSITGKGKGKSGKARGARSASELAERKIRGTWDPLTRSVWIHVTPTSLPSAFLESATHASASASGSDGSVQSQRAQRDSQGRIVTGRRAQTYASRRAWERGFFGKGTLSRSEPTWRDRKVGEIRVDRERAKGKVGEWPLLSRVGSDANGRARRRIQPIQSRSCPIFRRNAGLREIRAALATRPSHAPCSALHLVCPSTVLLTLLSTLCLAVNTPEELTAQRRRERKAAKIARARLAVRAGTQLPDGIVALGGELTSEDERALERIAERELDREEDALGDGAQEREEVEEEYGKHIPGLVYLKPKDEEGASRRSGATGNAQQTEPTAKGQPQLAEAPQEEEEWIEVQDMEVLQLNVYEVFFLAGMLDVLEVSDESGSVLCLSDLYALLCSTTLKPVHLPMAQLVMPSRAMLRQTSHLWARADNPFLLQYVAYHHFRSLGWVVKSGIKFCVDFLLYKKGPVFSHAEFAILVIPSYVESAELGAAPSASNRDEPVSAEAAARSSPFIAPTTTGDKSWVWFSTMNRVQSQVLKTLVLAYVTVPRTTDAVLSADLADPQRFVQRLKEGGLYSVREIAIRRWVPARMRA